VATLIAPYSCDITRSSILPSNVTADPMTGEESRIAKRMLARARPMGGARRAESALEGEVGS
jgi:hypothetical protein